MKQNPPHPKAALGTAEELIFKSALSWCLDSGVTFMLIHPSPGAGAACALRCPVGSPACPWFPEVTSSAGVAGDRAHRVPSGWAGGVSGDGGDGGSQSGRPGPLRSRSSER